jgi:ribosomal protein S21
LLKVEIRKGQSVEKALKIFKRKVKDSGIMFDLIKSHRQSKENKEIKQNYEPNTKN